MIKPPSEILEALKQGDVFTWNAWKRQQVDNPDLEEANLPHANLEGADLTGANLRLAKLQEAGLFRANLRLADLEDANLEGADLLNASLRLANLQGADLQDAYLPYSDLQGANLQGADLQGADLQGANLDGTGIAFRTTRLRCIITPDYAWLGCEGGTHEYWENLSKEDALALDEDAHLLWEHRDELLQLMKQCREAGWPKGDNDDQAAQ